jgi:ParB/RepB/Spo0J family partition protein
MSGFITLPLAAVTESTFNPRRHFDPAKLAELAENIKASGVHQPILVRPLPGARVPDTAKGVTHEIVAGARRFRASQLAGMAAIPAVVRDLDDGAALEVALWENIHRADLTALEEAEGYDALIRATGITREALAKKIGRSPSYVHASLKLLDLCPEARAALEARKLEASHALLLARLPSGALQAQALKRLLQADYSGDTMSYRAAAAYVKREFMLRLHDATFGKSDAQLLPEAGACKTCPKRTGANPDLFADVKGADVCTDPPCYRKKEAAHADAQLKAARQAAQDGGAELIEGREAKQLMPSSWSTRVEGYLRLDDAGDSPTDKPLRKLIGKQMEAAGITPVLVANPHKAGEIIAVLPAVQVTQLLRAAGNDKGADLAARKAQNLADTMAEQAREKAKRELEAHWRWQVLEAIWPAAQDQLVPLNEGINNILRTAAADYAGRLNAEKCKALCKLLDLGKVAPKDGVKQWIADAPAPLATLALMVAHSEVEYNWWRHDHDDDEEGPASGNDGNAALWTVADALGVDRAAIERAARSDARADAMKAKAAEKAAAAQAAKADPPLAPAARRSATTGAQAQRPAARRGKPAAPPAAPRTSETQAREGIAAALQAQAPAPGAADAAQSNDAPAVLRPPASGAVAGAAPADGQATKVIEIGDRVTVVEHAHPWCECDGTVRQLLGGGKKVRVRLDGHVADQVLPAESLLVIARAEWPALSQHKATAAAPLSLMVGRQVKVLASATGHGGKRWLGKVGAIVAQFGPEAWDVEVDFGRKGATVPEKRCFHASELEVLA